MDLGVGSFVFSQGVVSAIPLVKNPAHLKDPLLPKVTKVLRKCSPVLLLGLLRTISVKGTEYPVSNVWYPAFRVGQPIPGARHRIRRTLEFLHYPCPYTNPSSALAPRDGVYSYLPTWPRSCAMYVLTLTRSACADEGPEQLTKSRCPWESLTNSSCMLLGTISFQPTKKGSSP